MLSRLLKLSAKRPEVREGSVFQHKGPGNLIETAKVLDIVPDAMGIPHVRYDLAVERNKMQVDSLTSSRTLNLHSFTTHFTDTVEA